MYHLSHGGVDVFSLSLYIYVILLGINWDLQGLYYLWLEKSEKKRSDVGKIFNLGFIMRREEKRNKRKWALFILLSGASLI